MTSTLTYTPAHNLMLFQVVMCQELHNRIILFGFGITLSTFVNKSFCHLSHWYIHNTTQHNILQTFSFVFIGMHWNAICVMCLCMCVLFLLSLIQMINIHRLWAQTAHATAASMWFNVYCANRQKSNHIPLFLRSIKIELFYWIM